jgi:hypothetical protein
MLRLAERTPLRLYSFANLTLKGKSHLKARFAWRSELGESLPL